MISSLLPLPMGEVPLEGAERACLPSQSLRDSSLKVGAKGERGDGWDVINYKIRDSHL